MAILRSPAEASVVVPADQSALAADDPARITYTLRTPSLYDRTRLDRSIAAAGGASHGALDLLRALRRGVEVIMSDSPAEERAATIALIDRCDAEMVDFHKRVMAGEFGNDDPGEAEGGEACGGGDPRVKPEDRLEAVLRRLQDGAIDLKAIEQLVAAAYRPYASMVADNAVYRQIAAVESARLFVTGWTGTALGAFAAGRDGASEASLLRIPEAHLSEIGAAVQGLLRPTRHEEKNLSSPSSSPCAPSSSTASRTRARNGRSPAPTAAQTAGSSPKLT